MRTLRGLFPLLVAVILGFAAGSAARAADSVVIAAGQHAGFGRIAFRWPAPVHFTAKRDGTSVTIHFDRPLAGRLDRVMSELDGYVKAATIVDDDKAVRLELTRPFELRSFSDTPSVAVIDLVGTAETPEKKSGVKAAEKPAPSGKPPASAAGSSTHAAKSPTAVAAGTPKPASMPEAPRVEVRKGEHKGFDRLVFDWPHDAGYKLTQDGDSATLRFDRPAKIDLRRVERDPLRYAREVKVAETPSGVEVNLKLVDGVRLHDFRDGPRVALDLLAPTVASKAAAIRAARPAAQAKTKAAEARSAGAEPAKTGPTEAKPAKSEPVMVQVGPGAEANAAMPPATGAPVPLTKAAPVASPAPAPQAAPRPVPATVSSQEPVASKLTGGAPAEVLSVGYTAGPQGPTLSFPFTDTTNLAAFRRNDTLWLVFDRPALLDISKLPNGGDGKTFALAAQLPHLRGGILRLKVLPGVGATLRKDDPFGWRVTLAKQPDRPDAPITVSPEPNSPVGPRLMLPVANAAYPLVVKDPEVGDRLIVVPIGQPGWGVFQDRSYVEFRLLATEQGIVVGPKVDGIIVNSRKDEVDILGEKPLMLSAAPEKPSAGVAFGNAATTPALFDLAAWHGGTEQSPIERKQALQLKLASAPAWERNKLRLDLARFFFAEGMVPESSGMIDLIAKDHAKLLDATDVRVMRGALAALSRDYKAASKLLDAPNLETVPEAALWRGAVAAERHDYAKAEREFLFGGALIAHYPHPIQVELGLLAAETLLARGDKERAKALIAGFEKTDLSSAERGRIAYLHGREMMIADRPADALPYFEEAEKSSDAFGAARATLARIDLLERMGKLPRKEAIKRLDKLRYAWRGDSFELDLLDRLGRLYLADGNYREGLITLRRAVTYFPDDPRAKALAGLMSRTFADLFVKGGENKLSPLMAVAIYDEFKELTPTGPAGDEVALHLIDRLVAVDLLGRAEKMLEKLVTTRLSGAGKADAGARLAKVFLLDDNPAGALKALKESAVDGVTDPLATERRHLEARALTALGKVQDALSRLDGDVSPEADQIRAEAYWKDHRWAAAAQTYQRLAKDLPQAKSGLDPAQSNLVLRWAVALTMLGDRPEVDALRARFDTAFAPGPAREAFLVVTSDTGKPGEGFRKLATSVAELDRFKAFMDGYRKEFLDRAQADAKKVAAN